MNLGAPRARMLIGPEGPCRWRSNGHLRHCRFASGAFLQTLRSLAPGSRALVSRPALRGKNRLPHPATRTGS